MLLWTTELETENCISQTLPSVSLFNFTNGRHWGRSEGGRKEEPSLSTFAETLARGGGFKTGYCGLQPHGWGLASSGGGGGGGGWRLRGSCWLQWHNSVTTANRSAFTGAGRKLADLGVTIFSSLLLLQPFPHRCKHFPALSPSLLEIARVVLFPWLDISWYYSLVIIQ